MLNQPADVHVNSYPHLGTRRRGLINAFLEVLILQYFETILPSVESL